MDDRILKTWITAQNVVVDLGARLKRGESGSSMVEWALMLGFIAILVIGAFKILTPAVNASYTHVSNCLTSSATVTPLTSTVPSC